MTLPPPRPTPPRREADPRRKSPPPPPLFKWGERGVFSRSEAGGEKVIHVRRRGGIFRSPAPLRDSLSVAVLKGLCSGEEEERGRLGSRRRHRFLTLSSDEATFFSGRYYEAFFCTGRETLLASSVVVVGVSAGGRQKWKAITLRRSSSVFLLVLLTYFYLRGEKRGETVLEM